MRLFSVQAASVGLLTAALVSVPTAALGSEEVRMAPAPVEEKIELFASMADVASIQALGDRLYAIAREEAADDLELWSFDMEGVGAPVADSPTGYADLTAFGTKLLLHSGADLMTYDPATGDFTPWTGLPAVPIGIPTPTDDGVYVPAGTLPTPSTYFSMDGVSFSSASSLVISPRHASIGGRHFTSASSGAVRELVELDGATVTPLPGTLGASEVAAAGGELFYLADGDLFRLTPGGTPTPVAGLPGDLIQLAGLGNAVTATSDPSGIVYVVPVSGSIVSGPQGELPGYVTSAVESNGVWYVAGNGPDVPSLWRWSGTGFTLLLEAPGEPPLLDIAQMTANDEAVFLTGASMEPGTTRISVYRPETTQPGGGTGGPGGAPQPAPTLPATGPVTSPTLVAAAALVTVGLAVAVLVRRRPAA